MGDHPDENDHIAPPLGSLAVRILDAVAHVEKHRVGGFAPNKDLYKPWSGNIGEYFDFIKQRNSLFYEPPFSVRITPDKIDLVDLSNKKKKEVIDIYRNSDINKIEDEFDIFTIIPFSNRILHLEKTVESLRESANKSNLSIGILIVENSYKSEASYISDKFDNTYYIWVNSDYKFFNKCLCHNIGSYITKSKYLHFHDCDILVQPEFYSNIENKFISGESAIQCFCKRRVNYINEENTLNFFNGQRTLKNIIDLLEYTEGKPGAPGGSIALTRELFNSVGGFDPHFFWEYSIEDAFFWKKTEHFSHIVSLDDPAVELYHMWHPASLGPALTVTGARPHPATRRSVAKTAG